MLPFRQVHSKPRRLCKALGPERPSARAGNEEKDKINAGGRSGKASRSHGLHRAAFGSPAPPGAALLPQSPSSPRGVVSEFWFPAGKEERAATDFGFLSAEWERYALRQHPVPQRHGRSTSALNLFVPLLLAVIKS